MLCFLHKEDRVVKGFHSVADLAARDTVFGKVADAVVDAVNADGFAFFEMATIVAGRGDCSEEEIFGECEFIVSFISFCVIRLVVCFEVLKIALFVVSFSINSFCFLTTNRIDAVRASFAFFFMCGQKLFKLLTTINANTCICCECLEHYMEFLPLCISFFILFTLDCDTRLTRRGSLCQNCKTSTGYVTISNPLFFLFVSVKIANMFLTILRCCYMSRTSIVRTR